MTTAATCRAKHHDQNCSLSLSALIPISYLLVDDHLLTDKQSVASSLARSLAETSSSFHFSSQFQNFRCFENDFPLFFEKLTTKKKIAEKKEERISSLRHCQYQESSQSFGKQSLASWFVGARFFCF